MENKLIVYDSNCKVCSSWKDIVLRFTRIPETKITAYKDLNETFTNQVDPARFRNAMALVDVTGAPTIYGGEGIAYVFASQYRWVGKLFHYKPFIRVFDFLYKTQAYNRYIIATPKSSFQCDCFPEREIKYRVSYIVICAMISIALTALLGISLKPFFETRSATAASQMLLIAGTGWVLQIVLALSMLKDKALDYIGHLGSIMVAGLLVITPWMLFYAITAIFSPILPIISIACSSALMLYLHVHRARHLQISQVWTVSWFALLQTTALLWIYLFFIH